MSDAVSGSLPLVTFALFAYNQEQYIREAIGAAFAQTYEPLEIILSDDRSPDRTYEIMQEMAAAYCGPHKVRVRQSEVNFGTAQHVAAIASMMDGELMIVAAGDDISMPHRTKTLVDHWLSSGKTASALHSAMLTFDENDRSNTRMTRPPQAQEVSDAIARLAEGGSLPFKSPTCAYSRKLFSGFPGLVGGSLVEDGPLATRAVVTGPLISIDEPLILQRRLNESAGGGYRYRDPARWNRFVLSRIISARTSQRDLAFCSVSNDQKQSLEKLFLFRERRLAAFFLSEHRAPSEALRLLFFVRVLLFYPASYSLVNRVIFALEFCEMGTGILRRLKKVRRRRSARRYETQIPGSF